MKKFLSTVIITATAIWSASLWADNARIDIDGNPGGANLEISQKPEDGTAGNASWLEADKNKRYLTTEFPATGEWQQASFSFKADKDGKLYFELMGEWRPKDKNKPEDLEPVWIMYDDIIVKGAELKNPQFDTSSEGWFFSGKNEGVKAQQYLADQGHEKSGALKVWCNSPAVQEITAKAGQEVTVSFWFKTAK